MTPPFNFGGSHCLEAERGPAVGCHDEYRTRAGGGEENYDNGIRVLGIRSASSSRIEASVGGRDQLALTTWSRSHRSEARVPLSWDQTRKEDPLRLVIGAVRAGPSSGNRWRGRDPEWRSGCSVFQVVPDGVRSRDEWACLETLYAFHRALI